MVIGILRLRLTIDSTNIIRAECSYMYYMYCSEVTEQEFHF